MTLGFLPLAFLLSPIVAGPLQQRDTIRARVDLVVVPVAVRGTDGRLVYGLQKDDFQILEDGRLQPIQEVADSRTPLSVAILIDTGVGRSALERFSRSMLSLTSALVEGDEAAIYRFDHIVQKIEDFTTDFESIEARVDILKSIAASRPSQNRAPWNPLGGRGPRWLQKIVGLGGESRVLHQAVLEVAAALNQRSEKSRKILIVVSDGYVNGDDEFDAALDRLVRDQIQFYGIGVGMAVIEGRANVLSTYAGATGGEVFGGRTQVNMESAYARITEQARYPYVLTYVSNNVLTGVLPVERSIEVKVNRPNVRLRHRMKYWQQPLPPA